MQNYGFFNSAYGSYTITQLPKVGLYEYIYKNDDVLVKVDQFGLQTAQIRPPVGEALFKREKREIGSPVKVYFEYAGQVFNSFDVFRADSLQIDFTPEKATYALHFGALTVTTELFVTKKGMRFVMKTTFTNGGDESMQIKILPCAYPYVNALLMAPWDKPEWYTKTEYANGKTPLFRTTRYSVSGKKEERRYFTCLSDTPFDGFELSSERLLADTDNFTRIPDAFSGKTENVLYAFEQCFAAIGNLSLAQGASQALTLAFACAEKEEEVDGSVATSRTYFDEDTVAAELSALHEKYDGIFAKRTIETKDEDFNRFVNGFLPLELDWVSALDRGWPTGMRGVRDAANDFQGFLAYDKDLCRSVIANIFSKQRSDGWYPRQVPFGDSDKFDLRHFVDSACFFTEFVYDYLAFTDDYSVLDEIFPYYDAPDKKESGLEHLVAGMEYLTNPEHIGEHGLVKMQGGDWLDCLSAAGIKGRGETVMVSCQLVMCLRYLTEILAKRGTQEKKYLAFATDLEKAINENSFNEAGFYNGVFTDEGEWIFSTKDPDGERRVYAPTNAYAIISGVAKGKENSVLDNLKGLRTENGYKLFTTPFGFKPVHGIGKMGTGDFQPFFAENGSVYNHGSQCFLLRALAEVGDGETFSDVLNFALPLYADYHAPDALCGAPYAITNCYHLVPSFHGRTGFSFLTGSVAMIERAIYSWMLGIRFGLDEIVIKPCLPTCYADSAANLSYGNTRLRIEYVGSGSIVTAATLDGKALTVESGCVKIAKTAFDGKTNCTLRINLA